MIKPITDIELMNLVQEQTPESEHKKLRLISNLDYISLSQQLILAGDINPDVLSLLAGHKNLDKTTRNILLDKNIPQVNSVIATKNNLDNATIKKLLTLAKNQGPVLVSLARWQKLNYVQITELLNLSIPQLTSTIISYQKLPPTEQLHICESQDLNLQVKLASNSYITLQSQSYLLNSVQKANVKILDRLANNSNFAPSLQVKLLQKITELKLSQDEKTNLLVILMGISRKLTLQFQKEILKTKNDRLLLNLTNNQHLNLETILYLYLHHNQSIVRMIELNTMSSKSNRHILQLTKQEYEQNRQIVKNATAFVGLTKNSTELENKIHQIAINRTIKNIKKIVTNKNLNEFEHALSNNS